MSAVDPAIEAQHNKISPKLIAAMVGTGVGTVVAQVVLWLIGASITGRWNAAAVDATYAAVPGPLIAVVNVVLAVVGAYFPGFNTTDPLRQAGLTHLSEAEHSDGPAPTTIPEVPVIPTVPPPTPPTPPAS